MYLVSRPLVKSLLHHKRAGVRFSLSVCVGRYIKEKNAKEQNCSLCMQGTGGHGSRSVM